MSSVTERSNSSYKYSQKVKYNLVHQAQSSLIIANVMRHYFNERMFSPFFPCKISVYTILIYQYGIILKC